MDDNPQAMIYGANGYTGKLIARHAVERGLRPVLAGRNRDAVAALAGELNCPWRAFSLDDVAAVTTNLAGLRAVLHCAGPFSRTAEPMMDACLAAGAHYLDITGEIDVIESAAARHMRAKQVGVALLPAVGFDVVPSDCLAAMLAERLPNARLLQLAFSGTGGVSRGTAKTMLENVPHGGRARIDGKIRSVPVAWKTLEVPFADRSRFAMTIPWGDVASAYYSTSIPNIEVYAAAPRGQVRWLRRLKFLLPVLGLPVLQRIIARGIDRRLSGPTEQERREARGEFWGRVSDAQNASASATMSTPGGYEFTILTAVAALQRAVNGQVPVGFATPSQAFGREFILQFPGVELRWQQNTSQASTPHGGAG